MGKRRLYSIDQLSGDDFGVEMKPDVFDNDEKSQDQGGFLKKLDLATISDIFQLCKGRIWIKKTYYVIVHDPSSFWLSMASN